MAGHSKWAQIKRQKAAADFKKGAIFSKISREIHVAVREGGPNPEANLRLRMALERAKREGMPNDTIERAIAKASGAGADAENYETVIYEGYGPGGVAVLAVALTDNRNRTASEVRHAFSRHNGTLGETGCVAWQFETVGQIVISAEGVDPDEVALLAIDAGATDVETENGEIIITTDPSELGDVTERLKEAGLTIQAAEIQRVPQASVDVEGSQAQATLKLLEALEDLDDVQAVYTNANFPAEVTGAA
ncbi:YebC/PmpR family DNA-binding transcriptional regulator [Sphaerobacter sp.]|uniref:YebC/PmpR family DNA-binding transcriptional regulator n=1 Tax=Sphaerobacter sp. TaxID=2099654 RepID=UPI001D4E559E|nr:YebC/PmpR family DNA-binding transcriptional regulator [Sphaerobacter sp.]MBX5443661.1 YebC/PmpR family DNA-binding transcriptional regulator [Sphaerobacter sp.]